MNALFTRHSKKPLMKKTKNKHPSFLLIAMRTNMTESKNSLLDMRRKDIPIYLFFFAVHSQKISDQNSMLFAIISKVEGNLVLKVDKVKALSEGVEKVCSISDEN
jgi:hypothetical protein